MTKHCARAGFTLIELSIVLVIIGLIAGGVLVGRDLIESSKIRAQIGQIETYNTAIYTFKSKYNGIPGDLQASSVASFGMEARSGAAGHGDGNGVLETCAAGNSAAQSGCETQLFWRDLSYAQLIEGNFNSATDAITAVPDNQRDLYYPKARIGGENRIAVWNFSAINRFTVGKFSVAIGGIYFTENGMTPQQAYAIDVKMDDGAVLGGNVSGRVFPSTAGVAFTQITVGPTACIIVTPSLAYNLAEPYASQYLCNLNIKFN